MKKDGRLLFYFCNQKKKDYFNLIFSIDLFGVELLIHASLWFYLVLFVQFWLRYIIYNLIVVIVFRKCSTTEIMRKGLNGLRLAF